jgi:uncharacterized membrane protein
MQCTVGGESGYALAARRNNSLTSFDRILAFGLIAFVSLGIAIAFACLGAWLILPFAGIEVLVLYLAWRWIERHAHDYELVTIKGDVVEIEVADDERLQRFRFNRCWTQVICAPDGGSLSLRSYGKPVEFGRHLTNEQRLLAAGALRKRLRDAYPDRHGVPAETN